MLLGIPTAIFKRDYYMIDLPMLLFKKTQQIAEERMALLNIALAPNMKEESFKTFVNQLSRPLMQEDQSPDELDKEGLQALRNRLGKGGDHG